LEAINFAFYLNQTQIIVLPHTITIRAQRKITIRTKTDNTEATIHW